jgi:hypothetical protein
MWISLHIVHHIGWLAHGPVPAGRLRDPVVLSCASSCQLQWTSLGKLMKLQLIFSIYRSHNAVVEGSSPSLSTK